MFKDKKNRKAFRRFLDEMIKRQDVWIVNNWEAIQWMQQPTVQASVRSTELS